jgi:hypothetical protein
MQNMTTTDLRTKSSQLVKTLKEGKSVDLIHRSEIIGEIKPKIKDPKPFDAKKFLKAVKRLNLPKLSAREMDRRYRAAMEEKHGKGVS